MRNTNYGKHKSWKTSLVIGILSVILLSGCGKEEAPEETLSVNGGSESTAAEIGGMPEEGTAPDEKVMEQAVSEWKEMYAAFYEYQDCSAVLVERRENEGMVEEIFTLDITYISGQPESDEPEHFIADMKASYPADDPEDITLWLDNSGGAMTDFTLFKECGPG